jgi:sensor histidine kinase regulating citrate/malate metabolism
VIDFIKKYKWFIIGGLFLIVIGLIIFFVVLKGSPKKEIELNINESIFMEIGKCEYSDVTFESMNVDVVTVDQSGKIVAFGSGTTKVIAKNSKNKLCMTYEVKVKLPDLDVETLKVIDRIDASDITLNVGDIKKIEYSIEPIDLSEQLTSNHVLVALAASGS